MNKFSDHIYILSTIFFTTYSQLIMRWQVGNTGGLDPGLEGKIFFIVKMLTNIWVLSGIAATFLAGISWMMAMTKFEISYAFPFVSLNYILILVAGFIVFGESFSAVKAVGTLLVIAGLITISRG